MPASSSAVDPDIRGEDAEAYAVEVARCRGIGQPESHGAHAGPFDGSGSPARGVDASFCVAEAFADASSGSPAGSAVERGARSVTHGRKGEEGWVSAAAHSRLRKQLQELGTSHLALVHEFQTVTEQLQDCGRCQRRIQKDKSAMEWITERCKEEPKLGALVSATFKLGALVDRGIHRIERCSCERTRGRWLIFSESQTGFQECPVVMALVPKGY